MNFISVVPDYALPTIIIFIITHGFFNNVKVYDVFIDNAKEGISTILKIIPPLVGILVAVGVFKASGALDIIISFAKPIGSLIGVPAEVMPLAILRPISGSASLGFLKNILNEYGPDGYIGRTASTLMGSTETIFYTVAVYYGSVGIKNIRYTLIAAIIADIISVIVASWVCR